MAENAADALALGEDEIIQKYFAPLAAGYPGAFGLTDDGAVVSAPIGEELVVTTDPIIEGVHFLPDTIPFAIGWKALAVNISDLAAKGAKPLAYVMALALPRLPPDSWLTAFRDGLADAQRQFGCHLAGGDTDRTPGLLTISITAFGSVPAGAMVRRSGARPGDLVYVTGTIGDALLGLQLWGDVSRVAKWALDPVDRAFLVDRPLFPNRPPSVSAGFADILRKHATAAIDVSDGLVKDFDRLCRASNVGGRLDAACVPLSRAARHVLDAGGASLADLITGGEDYQVLLTVPPERAEAFEIAARACRSEVTRIGVTTGGAAVVVHGPDGRPLDLLRTGWDHFAP